MLYWVSGRGASSARLYWESFNTFVTDGRVELPTGVAAFPKEILRTPRRWCETAYNITHWTTMPRGGHFAAFEQPDLFVDDVQVFFATVRLAEVQTPEITPPARPSGPSRRPPATAPGFQRVGASAGEEQQQEGEAKHHRGLAVVVDRKEPLRHVQGKMGDRLSAASHECGGASEQAEGD